MLLSNPSIDVNIKISKYESYTYNYEQDHNSNKKYEESMMDIAILSKNDKIINLLSQNPNINIGGIKNKL